MATTATPRRQIADGSINNDKVGADAAIATSKLADGAKFVKNDGSVAFTGNISMGNQKLTGLGNGTADSDGINYGQLKAALDGLNTAYKYRVVRVKATGNVTISNPGTGTFDGIALTAGDALLGSIMLTSQTTQSENGLYLFNGSANALTRLSNSDAWSEITGSIVRVNEGTVNAGTRWSNTNADGGTLGTTAITYASDASNGLVAANFVDKELPSGAINGSNTAYTLANTPVAGSEHLYLNGILQESGAGNDYTISGTTITLATAPLAGEKIRVSYRK